MNPVATPTHQDEIAMTATAKETKRLSQEGSLELVALGLFFALVLVLAVPVFDAAVWGTQADSPVTAQQE